MITIQDARAAALAFTEAVKGNTVSAEEIVNRTLICRTCPRRGNAVGISRVSVILGKLANKHRVPAELGDSVCRACGCSLLLLIPATKENLHVDSPAESRRRPGRCWLKQALKQ